MLEDDRNNEFSTRNTALAAYLRTEGFILLDVIPTEDGNPAVFIFESQPKILEYEHIWYLGEAKGNLCDFWENYRLCLKMVKVGKL